MQPPSGGCVLKHPQDKLQAHLDKAATFGWLCVETCRWCYYRCGCGEQPPSGGCVLKRAMGGKYNRLKKQPPSGGCVLKLGSRLTL